MQTVLHNVPQKLRTKTKEETMSSSAKAKRRQTSLFKSETFSLTALKLHATLLAFYPFYFHALLHVYQPNFKIWLEYEVSDVELSCCFVTSIVLSVIIEICRVKIVAKIRDRETTKHLLLNRLNRREKTGDSRREPKFRMDGFVRVRGLLGKGASSTVAEFQRKPDEAIAVKHIPLANLLHASHCFREIANLRKCRGHENVLRYLHHEVEEFNGTKVLKIVTELCDRTMNEYCHELRWAINDNYKWEILRQTANGLGFLHDQRIVHLDLKHDNVFIKNDAGGKLRVKLGDLGSARVLGDSPHPDQLEAMILTLEGTPPFESPEKRSRDGYKKVAENPLALDVWSFGVVAFWLLTGGGYPFEPDRIPTLTQRDVDAVIRDFIVLVNKAGAKNVFAELRPIMKAAFNCEPRYRCSMAKICAFFNREVQDCSY